MLRTILNTLALLFPALIPSWRFFDVIAPSPRIQFCLVNPNQHDEADWTPFRPRPQHVGFFTMLKRMIWNPTWNEDLFMVSCAERLIECPNSHSEDEILKRVANALVRQHPEPDALKGMQLTFRLVLIQRIEDSLHEEIVFTSRAQTIEGTKA